MSQKSKRPTKQLENLPLKMNLRHANTPPNHAQIPMDKAAILKQVCSPTNLQSKRREGITRSKSVSGFKGKKSPYSSAIRKNSPNFDKNLPNLAMKQRGQSLGTDTSNPNIKFEPIPHHESSYSLGNINESICIVFMLEAKLQERLKTENLTLEQRVQAYTDTFQELIDKDKNYSGLLTKIKSVYEETIKFYKELSAYGKNRQKKLDARQVLAKLEALSKENVELYKQIEEKNQVIGGLKGELNMMKNSSIYFQNKEKSEQYITALQRENQKLKEICIRYKDRLKSSRAREKRLGQLQGIRGEVKHYSTPPMSTSPVKQRIPPLQLNQLNGSGMSKGCLSADFISTTSKENESERKGVPTLQIPVPGSGFHEEFMAKIDEFSESWRMQIQNDGR